MPDAFKVKLPLVPLSNRLLTATVPADCVMLPLPVITAGPLVDVMEAFRSMPPTVLKVSVPDPLLVMELADISS